MEKILKSLEKLNDQQLIAFCYLCSKYMIDNYIFFSKKYNWGDIFILNDTLNTINKILISKKKENINLNKMILSVDKQIPDTNDFSSLLCSFALDSSNCILETLKFINTNKVENVKNVATFCRDTVDMFIQEIEDLNYNDTKIEEDISNHELMLSELCRQKELINKIKLENDFNQAVIDKLDNINKKTKKPNLNLILD